MFEASRPARRPRYRAGLGIAVGLFFPAPVLAERSGPGEPEIGALAAPIVDLREDVGPPPPPRLGIPPVALAQGGHTLFVNFDGGNLSRGRDDSRTNTTSINECTGAFPAFGDASRAAAVLQAVAEDMSPFNLRVTGTRPASGNYTMVFLGPRPSCCAPGDGRAPPYCAGENPNAIAFVCLTNFPLSVSETIAAAISHEFGHTFGLAHVGDQSDIMRSVQSQTVAAFRDGCGSTSGSPSCPSQRKCGGGQQNSFREMLAAFGAKAADTMVPTVRIVSPMEGAVFGAGSTFMISAEVADDGMITAVELLANDQVTSSRSTPPFVFDAASVPAGSYTFVVQARDAAGNVGRSAPVHVEVRADAPTTTTGGGTASGTTAAVTGSGAPTGTGPAGGNTGTGGPGGIPGVSSSGTNPSGGSATSGGGSTALTSSAVTTAPGVSGMPATGMPGEMPPDAGCACAASSGPFPWWSGSLVPVVRRLRRRPRPAPRA